MKFAWVQDYRLLMMVNSSGQYAGLVSTSERIPSAVMSDDGYGPETSFYTVSQLTNGDVQVSVYGSQTVISFNERWFGSPTAAPMWEFPPNVYVRYETGSLTPPGQRQSIADPNTGINWTSASKGTGLTPADGETSGITPWHWWGYDVNGDLVAGLGDTSDGFTPGLYFPRTGSLLYQHWSGDIDNPCIVGRWLLRSLYSNAFITRYNLDTDDWQWVKIPYGYQFAGGDSYSNKVMLSRKYWNSPYRLYAYDMDSITWNSVRPSGVSTLAAAFSATPQVFDPRANTDMDYFDPDSFAFLNGKAYYLGADNSDFGFDSTGPYGVSQKIYSIDLETGVHGTVLEVPFVAYQKDGDEATGWYDPNYWADNQYYATGGQTPIIILDEPVAGSEGTSKRAFVR